ncbi:MAG: hypothetical protein L0Z62_20700 [Gemmataceae bacterium]|nr:hypothetical protein [Gemmataceae bacterium]
MPMSPVRLHAHPPERRRRQTVTLPCGCCCCCCCLHTIGGLLGAAIGSAVGSTVAPRAPRPYPSDEELVDRHGRRLFSHTSASISAVALYWFTLLGLIGLTFVLSCAGGALRGRADSFEYGPGWGLMILALFLPGIQLVASVITMFLAAVTNWNDAAARVWVVAKITLGTVIGTGIGIGLLFLVCVGFRW